MRQHFSHMDWPLHVQNHYGQGTFSNLILKSRRRLFIHRSLSCCQTKGEMKLYFSAGQWSWSVLDLNYSEENMPGRMGAKLLINNQFRYNKFFLIIIIIKSILVCNENFVMVNLEVICNLVKFYNFFCSRVFARVKHASSKLKHTCLCKRKN